MTGTLPKKKSKKLLLFKLGLHKCKRYDYSMSNAIDNKVISDYKIYLVKNGLDNTTKNILSGNKTNRFYQTELQKYTYLSNKVGLTNNFNDVLRRMRFLHNLPSKLLLLKRLLPLLKDKRGLIFTSSIDISNSLGLPTYNSKTDDTNLIRFQNKEINQLCLVNAGGVGYTYRDIDFVILHQIDSNKLGNSIQKLSRSLLYRKGYIPSIYILYTVGTQEVNWLKSFLESVDMSKVKNLDL